MLSDPRAVVPRFSGERAEWATDGQEAGQPPSLMLITELPRVPARILSGFSFSWKTPCGGAGTLAAAPAWRQRAEIYIFLGWPLPLAEGASFVGTRRSALPRLAHLLQPRKEPRPEDRESAADSSTAANAGPRVHAACDTPLPGLGIFFPSVTTQRSRSFLRCCVVWMGVKMQRQMLNLYRDMLSSGHHRAASQANENPQDNTDGF
ncbi:uncharacterized protein isoform X1 [Castor canadensis]|uniref:Uncharacterized protein isoform X1 n=1 Tax=Castor canadensis TaxID=51338 RepID=A0AC58L1H1_CASCN